ncbi:aminotransferase class I/II-fold pyridoxal phosphate-dependent enzyme [Streptomyces sp. NPDC006992]|uniref:aminotransferase class I/II-fold pyridoxal phosphate-dependent enzyme n=1 Tax=Streptomyces sp. NPDC006992 TaxID=3155601 RepID=UPI0033CB2E29
MRRTDQIGGGSAELLAVPSVAAVREAACGYWHRRGLPTGPPQVAVAPGAPLLLLTVLAAAAGAPEGGGEGLRAPGSVLLPHPCPPWHAAQARQLGRTVHTVPVPAECGGVPDPFALLEAVRRSRDAGEFPHALVLSVADDITGTAAPPELLHEVCEAAVAEGLLIVSDETWRDTSHDPHDTVVVSPAEMLTEAGRADHVVVLAGLKATDEVTAEGPGSGPGPGPGPGPAEASPGLSPGIARFADTERGRTFRERVHHLLAELGAGLPGPVAAAAAAMLREPPELLSRRAEAARLRGEQARALHRAVTAAGAVCRPPHLGRHLYVDLDPFRPRLAARGVTDAARLEAELVRRLGPYVRGGHRFGDDPGELRVRLTTDLAAGAARSSGRAGGAGGPVAPGAAGPTARPHPQEWPGAAETLAQVQSVLVDLTDGSCR